MQNPLSRRLRTTLFYALRTAFRLTPMPQGTRDRLRERFLDTKGHWVPEGPKGQAPTGDLPRRPYVRSDERAIGYVPYEKGELPDPLPATLVAFYLPQFHTIPENDAWWGKGFTEWRNVTRALPQFEGHYQPKLPGDLGFYDLRNVEVMHEQARLAREYGISAFCFYFYWFGGKTLLETPLRNWLNDKTIDLKFCLCWANEKWTRTWDGRGDEILIDQKHSPEDDIAFIAHVAEYMRDPRYLRVDGKPMLVVYRPSVMVDMKSTSLCWRAWCRDNGIGEIHVSYVQSFEKPNPSETGADSAIEFPPNAFNASSVSDRQHLINPSYKGSILDWRDIARLAGPEEQYHLIPCVNPSWDNEARRPGKGRTFLYASPQAYRDWLASTAETLPSGKDNHRLIFINAWNEWAEGAMLEPSAYYGYAWLEATRDGVRLMEQREKTSASLTVPPCAVIHAWHPELLPEILLQLQESRLGWRVIITTTLEREMAVRSCLQALGQENIEVAVFENRGRDILPFIKVAHRLEREGLDVVLKLHTKKSTHRQDGDIWRKDLIEKLTSQQNASTLFSAFLTDETLGLVAPTGHLLPLNFYWGANEANVTHLASRMGLQPPEPASETFIAGSMFWARLRALRPLLDANLGNQDFEFEEGQVDGTMAHAVERIFVYAARSAGMKITTSAKPHGLNVEEGAKYAFARKG